MNRVLLMLRVIAPLAIAPVAIAPAALAALLLSTPLMAQDAELDAGERAWEQGQELSLRGAADSALAAYGRALDMARRDRDPGLASGARLGMAQVFDVWRQCDDSAEVAYREAVQMSEPGDFVAADAYVRWLATHGRASEAQALNQRTYAGIEVPQAIKRESINFLLGQAAIQRGAGNGAAALATLTNARDIADRLSQGGVDDAPTPPGVHPLNYWVLHDLAELRLDPKAGGARNASIGNALMAELDAAAGVSDAGGVPRFTVARLTDRVARLRRACGDGPCETPPPPARPNC